MTTRARLLAGLATAAIAVLTPAAPAAPAAAHPFGPPATAAISTDGGEVGIVWRAAEDDWVALGQALGAFEDPALGPVAAELTGEQKLERSAAVHDYLTERIGVSQAGHACPVALLPLEDLLQRGARLRFDCPAPVTEIEVRLDVLTDLNAAYRTMLTADGSMTPPRALFTSTRTTHLVALTGGGPSAVAPLAIATGVTVAVALAVLIARWQVRRRRTR